MSMSLRLQAVSLITCRCSSVASLQCANGAAFCQLLDSYFPGVVPMHKVRMITSGSAGTACSTMWRT